MGDKRKPGKINPEEVDPSIYYYDEVYDDDKKAETEVLNSHAVETKSSNSQSKYITKIKEEADLRRTEKDIRKFKRYARDRPSLEDGNEEVFVTSSYKKKLAEIEKIEKSLKIYQPISVNKPSQSCDRIESKSKDERITTIESMPSTTVVSKQLKTFDDRKRYLQKVLSKRTVGKVYLDAVERFKQRKLGTS